MNWSFFISAFFVSAKQVQWRLLAIGLTALLLATGFIYGESPQYKTSWILLLPGTERASTINFDNLGEARSSGKNAYGSVSISPKTTYKEIALSNAVIHTAATRFGVSANAFSKPKIQLIDQTPAIQFTLKGSSEAELRRRAEIFNETFHNILDELRSNEIERHYQGVESNLSEAKNRLQRARQAITTYQLNGSIVSDQQFKIWLATSETIRERNFETRAELSALAARLESKLQQLGISEQQAQDLLVIQANPTTQALLREFADGQAAMAKIDDLYGDANPIRLQIQSELNGLTDTLDSIIGHSGSLSDLPSHLLLGLLASDLKDSLHDTNQLITEIAGLSATSSEQIRQHDEYTARIKDHINEAAELNDLTRDHQIAEAIFSSALAKLDTSKLDIYATYPLTQLLTHPGATIKRDRLKTKLTLLALMLAAILVALAVILQQMRNNNLTPQVPTRSPIDGQTETDNEQAS